MKNEITSVYYLKEELKSAIKRNKLKSLSYVLVVILMSAIFSQAINASRYDMTVNVKDGENILGINPMQEKLDFGDLSRNNGMKRYISLKSDGNVPTYIAILQLGEISDLVKPERNFFVLPSGNEMKLAFEIKIPPSAATKTYSGKVWIFRFPKLL